MRTRSKWKEEKRKIRRRCCVGPACVLRRADAANRRIKQEDKRRKVRSASLSFKARPFFPARLTSSRLGGSTDLLRGFSPVSCPRNRRRQAPLGPCQLRACLCAQSDLARSLQSNPLASLDLSLSSFGLPVNGSNGTRSSSTARAGWLTLTQTRCRYRSAATVSFFSIERAETTPGHRTLEKERDRLLC